MREGIILMFDAQGTSVAWTRSDFAGQDGGCTRCVTMVTDSQWKSSWGYISSQNRRKSRCRGEIFWELLHGVCKKKNNNNNWMWRATLGEHIPQRHNTVLTHTHPSSSLSHPYLPSSQTMSVCLSVSPSLHFFFCLSWAGRWSRK